MSNWSGVLTQRDMDFDFDFGRKRTRRHDGDYGDDGDGDDGHRGHRGHRDDDDDRGHRDDRRGRRSSGSQRRGLRARPHVFAWLLLGGGALLLVGVLMAIALSAGLWGYVSDAYFAVTKLILPDAWHDTWTSLPGVAHVAMALGAVFVTAGVAGEVFD